MYRIQQILNAVYDVLFCPFQARDPTWMMLWVSVLTAVLVLLVYRYLSPQGAIRSVKDRLKAHILEIRLFQEDPLLMAKAVHAVLVANLTYLRLNVKPFLFVFLPVSLMLVQMDARFGYRPLLPAESAVVRTFWGPPVPNREESWPRLIPLEGVSVRTPPVRIEEGNEIDWEIRVTHSGSARFAVQTAEDSVALPVIVSSKILPVNRRNVPKGALDVLRYPTGQPLPSKGDLLAVEIGYPQRDFRLFGNRIHWIWPFLALSLLGAYLLQGVFRVRF